MMPHQSLKTVFGGWRMKRTRPIENTSTNEGNDLIGVQSADHGGSAPGESSPLLPRAVPSTSSPRKTIRPICIPASLVLLVAGAVAAAAHLAYQSFSQSSRSADDPIAGRPILDGLFATVVLSRPGGCSGTQEALLDIYPSPNNSAAPTVLHIPGGAYMTLASLSVESVGAQYIDAGYTLAVLWYRLPRSWSSPIVCSDPWEAIEDTSAAMRQLRDNATMYHVDTDKIVTSGFSAGGHLAALYSSVCEERSFCPCAQVLHFPWFEQGAQVFCSDIGTAFTDRDDYNNCFPTALVNAATPPTVLYHASGDGIVPTKQVTDFVSALGEHGVPFAYFEVPGGGHGLVGFDNVNVVAASNGSDCDLDGEANYTSLLWKALSLSKHLTKDSKRRHERHPFGS